jgi:hypothetical protein
LLAFLRSSNFSAHHETLARAIAVPPARASRLPNAASWVKHSILQSGAGINRSNQYIIEKSQLRKKVIFSINELSINFRWR